MSGTKTKACVVCGKEFGAKGRAITCGPICARKRHRATDNAFYMNNKRRPLPQKECLVCGKVFEPFNWQQKTCGKRHSKKYQLQQKRNRNRLLRVDPEYCERERPRVLRKVDRLCAICLEKFKPKVVWQVTCSEPCSKENKLRKKKNLYQSDPEYRAKLIENNQKCWSNPVFRMQQNKRKRDRHRQRYQSDPEFRSRYLKRKADRAHQRWHSDSEYRQNKIAQNTQRRAIRDYQARRAIALAEISEALYRLQTLSKGKTP